MPWNPTFPKFWKNTQIYGNVEQRITHANVGELYITWKLEQSVIFQISEMRTSVTQVFDPLLYIHAIPMLLICGAFRARNTEIHIVLSFSLWSPCYNL